MRANYSVSLFGLAVILGHAASLASASGPSRDNANRNLPRIKNLVLFGDSFTAPELATTGGAMWPHYAAQYGQPDLSWSRVYSFAKLGASCNNQLTPRPVFPSPSVVTDEIPEYLASNLSQKLNMRETLFVIWIGTNDLGFGNLITGDTSPGVTAYNTTRCAVDLIYTMHQAGARNFLFLNTVPLNLAPLYRADGLPWPYYTKPYDPKSWNIWMQNVIPVANGLAERWLEDAQAQLKGARIGLFDVHSLFADIDARPSLYLNGTLPLSTSTGPAICPYTWDVVDPDTGEVVEPGKPIGGACPAVTNKTEERDSFLWYDEVHPSEQAARIIAKEVVSSIQKGGKESHWTRWL